MVPRLMRIWRIQWCCLLSFWPEIPFLGIFGSKIQNYLFKMKFIISTNSNIQNSMVMFPFSVFDGKYPFWEKMVQKIKIVSLSLNLVPRLIWIYRKLSGDVHFFRFRPEIPFLGKFDPKIQITLFKMKFSTTTNSNM